MCSGGDFPIASGDNGHQVSSAKVAKLKTSLYIFGNFKLLLLLLVLLLFRFRQFTHCFWISKFGEISPKKKTLFGRSQCDKQIS